MTISKSQPINKKHSTRTSIRSRNKRRLSQSEYREALEERQITQDLEDMKPVVLPKELDEALHNTFKDVKCHWYPLDGLYWTKEQLATQGGGSRNGPRRPPPLSLSALSSQSLKGVHEMLPRSQSEPNISILSTTRTPHSSPKSNRRESKENKDPNELPSSFRKRTVTFTTSELPSLDAQEIDSNSMSIGQCQPEFILSDTYDEGDLKTPTAPTRRDRDEIQTSFIQQTSDETDIDEMMQIFPELRCTTPHPPPSPSLSTADGDFGSDPLDLFAFESTPEEFKNRRANFNWFGMGRS
ncbi:hypothetical protein E1B28_009512 [Marasmius oreades]|uniref:Uncharacterized protein n=1 Tax=Marasmius oreades TaxID=181124 RepID=A0A9P7UQI9_9AGAR|nr:uncharacterized protein E1B28_009512 [Marasmius oreades]KAG7090393.1 hypothetical protein E1B28_009512 [Marasmius oreades]